MATIKKEKLKTRNPYIYYRNWFFGFKICKYLSIFAPFIIIFILKFDEYFQISDGQTTVKLSLGCALAALVGGVAIYKEMKQSETGNQITGVIGWAVAFALCYLLQSILADLTIILGAALIGQLAGLGFEFGAENRKYYMNKYISFKKARKGLFSDANKAAFSSLTKSKANNKKETIPYE